MPGSGIRTQTTKVIEAATMNSMQNRDLMRLDNLYIVNTPSRGGRLENLFVCILYLTFCIISIFQLGELTTVPTTYGGHGDWTPWYGCAADRWRMMGPVQLPDAEDEALKGCSRYCVDGQIGMPHETATSVPCTGVRWDWYLMSTLIHCSSSARSGSRPNIPISGVLPPCLEKVTHVLYVEFCACICADRWSHMLYVFSSRKTVPAHYRTFATQRNHGNVCRLTLAYARMCADRWRQILYAFSSCKVGIGQSRALSTRRSNGNVYKLMLSYAPRHALRSMLFSDGIYIAGCYERPVLVCAVYISRAITSISGNTHLSVYVLQRSPWRPRDRLPYHDYLGMHMVEYTKLRTDILGGRKVNSVWQISTYIIGFLRYPGGTEFECVDTMTVSLWHTTFVGHRCYRLITNTSFLWCYIRLWTQVCCLGVFRRVDPSNAAMCGRSYYGSLAYGEIELQQWCYCVTFCELGLAICAQGLRILAQLDLYSLLCGYNISIERRVPVIFMSLFSYKDVTVCVRVCYLHGYVNTLLNTKYEKHRCYIFYIFKYITECVRVPRHSG